MRAAMALAAISAASAVPAAAAPPPSAEAVELPKSAYGVGGRGRARHTHPAFDREALKRKRKLARKSQRRNRGRS